MKDQNLSALKKADSSTIEEISELCPVLNQQEQNQLFERCQKKYQIRRKNTEDFAETETFEAEPIRRTVNLINIGAAAACLLVCAGTVGGGIYLLKRPYQSAPGQAAENIEIRLETEYPVTETASAAGQSEIIETTTVPEATAEICAILETKTETTVTASAGETTKTPETKASSAITTSVRETKAETSAKIPETRVSSAVTTSVRETKAETSTIPETKIPETKISSAMTVTETALIPTEPEFTEQFTTVPETTLLTTTETQQMTTVIQTQTTETPIQPTESPTETLPELIPIDFVQHIREDTFDFDAFSLETGGSCTARVITSPEEMKNLISELIPAETSYLTSAYQKFGKYDDAFFEENHDLIVVLVLEPSGSFWHEVQEISVDNENNCTVTIDRQMPMTCTEDLANWAICIETDKSIEKINSLQIKFNNIQNW